MKPHYDYEDPIKMAQATRRVHEKVDEIAARLAQVEAALRVLYSTHDCMSNRCAI
jgi:hypothetical protein